MQRAADSRLDPGADHPARHGDLALEALAQLALHGPWAQFMGLFNELLGRLPRRHQDSEQLARLLSWFKDLQQRVEAAYLRATGAVKPVENSADNAAETPGNTQETTPREVISEPHIPTTNQLDLVTSNTPKSGKPAATVPNALAKEPVGRDLETLVAETRKKRAVLDLPTILQACPEFASWARNMGGFVRDWGDLHRVAGQLSPMIGISALAWNITQDRMGKQLATAAFALVFEKHSAGEVASPGGYLRGMVEKAGAGDLHLERSFYGRLSGQAA
ncbi:MAG: replication initiation protein RepC, partial [Pseudomonadota bacterium]|nr:replication initiation protein RepC [Pseudomonadota bacterium]